MIQGLGRNDLQLLLLFGEHLQVEQLLVEVSRNSTARILDDQGLPSCQMLGRSVGNDLVNDIVELDLEVFGDDAVIMDGEEEIQVNCWVEGAVNVIRRTRQDSKLSIIKLDKCG